MDCALDACHKAGTAVVVTIGKRRLCINSLESAFGPHATENLTDADRPDPWALVKSNKAACHHRSVDSPWGFALASQEA